MDWLNAHRPARRDAAAAVAFAVLWFGGLWVGPRYAGWYPSPRASYQLAGVAAVAVLLARETWPRPTFFLATLVFPAVYVGRVVDFLTGGNGMISEFHLLPVVLASYTVAARGRLKTWVVLLLAELATGAMFLGIRGAGGVFDDLRGSPAYIDLSGLAVLQVAVAALVLAGRAVYKQDRARASARRRDEQLQRAQTQSVVSAERTRIARELHDLVAHHISAVVIRAQAADRVADAQPEATREAIRWIAANGQETLAAMRQVVRVLRSSEEGTSLTPQATLAELPEIARRMQAVGLAVDLDLPLELPALPASVELAAVRIVQEGLTNVLVHARATRAVVELRADPDELRITIHDDGTAGSPPTEPIEVLATGGRPRSRPTPRPMQSPMPGSVQGSATSGGGHGLIGMRERAASCGGHLAVGTSPLGGWLITAVLNLRLGLLALPAPESPAVGLVRPAFTQGES